MSFLAVQYGPERGAAADVFGSCSGLHVAFGFGAALFRLITDRLIEQLHCCKFTPYGERKNKVKIELVAYAGLRMASVLISVVLALEPKDYCFSSLLEPVEGQTSVPRDTGPE